MRESQGEVCKSGVIETMQRFVLFIAIVLLASSPLVLGQGTLSTIRGTALDPTGAVVIGTTVTVTDADTGVIVRTVETNQNGNYEVRRSVRVSIESGLRWKDSRPLWPTRSLWKGPRSAAWTSTYNWARLRSR